MAKILLVDDSKSFRAIIKDALVGRGYEIVEADDGHAGIAAMEAHPDVKLILCDVNMPNMDGLTMCETLSRKPDAPKVPIFMLTTESAPEMKVRGKAAGVVAWVPKPVAQDRLIEAVATVLSK